MMHLVYWDEITYYKKEEFDCTHTGINLMLDGFGLIKINYPKIILV